MAESHNFLSNVLHFYNAHVSLLLHTFHTIVFIYSAVCNNHENVNILGWVGRGKGIPFDQFQKSFWNRQSMVESFHSYVLIRGAVWTGRVWKMGLPFFLQADMVGKACDALTTLVGLNPDVWYTKSKHDDHPVACYV